MNTYDDSRKFTKAATFGIVYDINSKDVLIIVIPDTDDELHSWPLNPGTNLLITPAGPSDIFTCQRLVDEATS